ncbi:putative glutathione S-transferase [Podospora australis]|uniref:Glutathione S-transferase n=1 Tax=Podospora australis TaxID=1536484 RepID=A0AAN6X2Y0_9PEZI|nr:putative glutathione S-transferase [Podospora australis]
MSFPRVGAPHSSPHDSAVHFELDQHQRRHRHLQQHQSLQHQQHEIPFINGGETECSHPPHSPVHATHASQPSRSSHGTILDVSDDNAIKTSSNLHPEPSDTSNSYARVEGISDDATIAYGIRPNEPQRRKQLPRQRQTCDRQKSSPLAMSVGFDDATGYGPSQSGGLPVRMVADPPNRDEWRRRLFNLESTVLLSNEEFETYFPWVDNVYSHRSTQLYKKKPFITHYWDCRLKGRAPGTPKPEDPNRKKRKRSVRERDQCDVKIKITQYHPGAASILQGDDRSSMDTEVLEKALTISENEPFWTIQRINHNGLNAVGDSRPPPVHKHDLSRSDEIKKSSVRRWLAALEQSAKRAQKPWPWKPTGDAATTAKVHSQEADIKFYAACFCPFSQRVWIALEAKGIAYQYCETYPLRKPKPTQLLEANPRGLVPVIQQGKWACAESSVILEYLEDLSSSSSSGGCNNSNSVVLHPTDPQLRANCRLWIEFINARIVPSFYALLSVADDEAHVLGSERLDKDISELVQAADEEGPYFLGDHICLVDIHLAPFALRLSRLLKPFRGWKPPPSGSRLDKWLEALENNPHIRRTTSAQALYVKSLHDLAKGYQGKTD